MVKKVTSVWTNSATELVMEVEVPCSIQILASNGSNLTDIRVNSIVLLALNQIATSS